MNYFLAKTDPETYSIDDLVREGQTTWDGVRNAQAVIHIKTMSPGDKILIYHSGGITTLVGLAEVTSAPRPNPNDPKSWVFDLKFLQKFANPVTLREIKETGQFNDWSLVRHSRLSTMPVPPEFVDWLRDHKKITL